MRASYGLKVTEWAADMGGLERRVDVADQQEKRRLLEAGGVREKTAGDCGGCGQVTWVPGKCMMRCSSCDGFVRAARRDCFLIGRRVSGDEAGWVGHDCTARLSPNYSKLLWYLLEGFVVLNFT